MPSGRIRDEELWRRVKTSYENGYTIQQLARRFRLTDIAIRYILAKQNALKKTNKTCTAHGALTN